MFGNKFKNRKAIGEYMLENKTDWALKVFDYDGAITFPQYIENAIEQ